MTFGFFDDPYQGQLENPFDPVTLVSIAKACSLAWQRVPSFSYKKSCAFREEFYSDERELNKRMVEILNYLLDDETYPWFTSSDFSVVVRDARQVAANLNDDEESPDLTFRLQNYPRGISRDDCALFLECKVLDGTSNRGSTYYVTTGVERFVSAKYAPRMPVAMLLAYCIGNNKLPDDLEKCFSKSHAKGIQRTRPKLGIRRYAESCNDPKIYVTLHARSTEDGTQLADLSLLHVWVAPTRKPSPDELRQE